jgi:hypothetical protein
LALIFVLVLLPIAPESGGEAIEEREEGVWTEGVWGLAPATNSRPK